MHDSDRSKALKSRAIHSLDEVALLVSGFSWHWRFRSVRRTGAAGRCVFRRKEAWEYNSTAYCRLRSTWDLLQKMASMNREEHAVWLYC